MAEKKFSNRFLDFLGKSQKSVLSDDLNALKKDIASLENALSNIKSEQKSIESVENSIKVTARLRPDDGQTNLNSKITSLQHIVNNNVVPATRNAKATLSDKRLSHSEEIDPKEIKKLIYQLDMILDICKNTDYKTIVNLRTSVANIAKSLELCITDLNSFYTKELQLVGDYNEDKRKQKQEDAMIGIIDRLEKSIDALLRQLSSYPDAANVLGPDNNKRIKDLIIPFWKYLSHSEYIQEMFKNGMIGTEIDTLKGIVDKSTNEDNKIGFVELQFVIKKLNEMKQLLDEEKKRVEFLK